MCEQKLTADNEQKHVQFRPRDHFGEENLKHQMIGITDSLQELKNLMMQQKEEHQKMTKTIEWVPAL